MEKNILVQTSILIHAELSEVWNALTNPEVVKKYFFGTDLVTTWGVGGPILFRGIWEGKPYEDKGVVQTFVPMESLSYTYRSSFDDTPDVAENYKLVTYRLISKDLGTELCISQWVEDEEKAKHSEDNWNKLLSEIKKLLETK